MQLILKRYLSEPWVQAVLAPLTVDTKRDHAKKVVHCIELALMDASKDNRWIVLTQQQSDGAPVMGIDETELRNHVCKQIPELLHLKNWALAGGGGGGAQATPHRQQLCDKLHSSY